MREALVLLRDTRLPHLTEVLQAYSRIAAAGPVLLAEARGRADDAIQAYRLATRDAVQVALMPAAVPDGDAESAAQYSISSFGTGWVLPGHRAHLVVVLDESESRPAKASLQVFTRVVAAIAEASGAVGIYWGDARATHAPAFFIDLAERGDDQLMLWTGVRVASDGQDRVSLLTLGMGQLDQPDVLLTAPRRAGNDALRFLFDVLSYFVHRGGPVPEGDMVGRNARETLLVRWVASPVDPAKRVVRIDLPDVSSAGVPSTH